MRSPFREFDIKTLLDEVQRSAKRVKGAAEHLSDATQMAVHKDMQTVRNTTTITQIQVARVDEGVTEIIAGVNELNVQNERTNSRFDEITESQKRACEQIADALASQNSMHRMLGDELSMVSPFSVWGYARDADHITRAHYSGCSSPDDEPAPSTRQP